MREVNMKKTWKKLTALLCASVLVLSGLCAHAAEGEFDVSGSKKADPTELACPERQTEVTLQLPAGEYKYVYDIVFVMDSSSSTSNSNINFSTSVTTLMDSVKDKNVTLKVGVIKDRGLAFDTISLVTENAKSGMIEYNDDNKQIITDAIDFAEAELKKLSSGTNMHGGLKKANEWLEADSSVPNDHKFVFFLTDGKMYIWNDDDDVATSVYGQYMAKNVVYGVPAVGQQTIAYSKSAYKFTDNVNFFSATAEELANLSFDEYFAKTKNFYANDFAKLYASTNEELSGKTKYDYRCGYAYKESASASGTVTEHAVSNGNYTYNLHKKYYEFTPAEAFADLNWLQANPYTVEESEGVYSYTTTINPDFYQLHPDGLQKALYLAGHLWTDMVAKYNGVAIVYSGWSGGSGLEIAQSFNTWIKSAGISDYSAEMSDEASVTDVFNTVKETILYMVSSGVVTDEIANPYTLVNADAADAFSMTLGGADLAVSFADGKWNFGTADAQGVYPYVVEYDDSTKTITWTINVPIENATPVTLTYTLELPEDEDVATGNYPTNKSAVLNYKSSDGTKDGTFTFEVPEVNYVACAEVKVEKIWDDNDNEAGKRPEKVEVVLMNDGKELMTLTLSDENDWAGTFVHNDNVHIPENILDKLSVKEVSVDGYECEVSGDAKDGFKITNTYVPPTTEEETTPPTGDSTNILPFVAIFVMAAAAFVVLSTSKTQEER